MITYMPAVALAVVFALTAARRVGSIETPMWAAMLFGAIAVLLTGSTGPARAVASINADVMIFLSGMFVVGSALEKSGYLYHISYAVFKGARSVDALIFRIIFATALSSALLLNDTIAIIGTPLMIYFSKRHAIRPKVLLLTLCFSITIGSVTSPIGNPQNILIAALGKHPAPFLYFFKYLFVPTVANLFASYFIIRFFYRQDFHSIPLTDERDELKDDYLAFLSKISLAAVALTAALKGVGAVFYDAFDFNISYIAVAGALPILAFAKKRVEIVRSIDWRTLVFFASMFILTDALWGSGIIQRNFLRPGAASIDSILVSGVLVSQVLSNVPFVALYMPLLAKFGAGAAQLCALAAGSTIAGNVLILGAASNVIVVQNAGRSKVDITFFEFARVGVLLAAINIAIYRAWFGVIG